LQNNKTAVFEVVRRGRIPREFQTDLTENRTNSAKQSQFDTAFGAQVLGGQSKSKSLEGLDFKAILIV
jgi:hypothetical protein